MDNEFLLEMGSRIKSKRVELGYSQEELAKKCGFKGRSAISMIELGLRDIAHDKIVALAKALGISPAYIMGWKEPEVNEYNIETDKSRTQIEIEDRLSNLTEGQLKAILSIVKEMEG